MSSMHIGCSRCKLQCQNTVEVCGVKKHITGNTYFQEKRKDRETWKSRSEEKVVGFSSASPFPARKQETVTQSGTIDPEG